MKISQMDISTLKKLAMNLKEFETITTKEVLTKIDNEIKKYIEYVNENENENSDKKIIMITIKTKDIYYPSITKKSIYSNFVKYDKYTLTEHDKKFYYHFLIQLNHDGKHKFKINIDTDDFEYFINIKNPDEIYKGDIYDLKSNVMFLIGQTTYREPNSIIECKINDENKFEYSVTKGCFPTYFMNIPILNQEYLIYYYPREYEDYEKIVNTEHNI